MKAIWTALCVLAIANVIAMAVLVGWLMSSGRVDARRVQEVRQLFAETIAARAAREADAEAKAKADEAAAQEAGKFQREPVTATQLLDQRIELTELDRQRAERLRRDVDDLKAGLARQQDVLNRQQAALDAERAEFEAMRKKIAETEGSAQFKKTLGVLEAMKPEQALATVQSMLAEDREQGMEKVVSYVNAMQDRPRSKLFAKIVESDPNLAAELLERVRNRGVLMASSAGGPTPQDPPPAAP